MKQLAAGAGALFGVLLAFVLCVALLLAAVDTPSVAQQLGVIDCTIPAAGVQAAGQVQVLTSTRPETGTALSEGVDAATSATPVRTPPKGYQATQGAGAGVMWRTDRWARTAAGRIRGGRWVTLRSTTATTMTVLALTTAPVARDLSGVVSRATGSGAVLVTGPSTGWPQTRRALSAARLVISARILGKARTDVFLATLTGGELVPVQHQRVSGGGLLVGMSSPGHSAGTGAPRTGALPAGSEEGGIGFALPGPRQPRKASVTNRAQPIPATIKALYVAAAGRYKIPWTLLAGIGMEETNHGRNKATSSAGAQGLMQFMPATFARYGLDGDHDGRTDIRSAADSIFAAANYLSASGVTKGAAGVRRALFSYNHADWYVNDVLTYAAAYGGGTVLGDPTDCGGHGEGNPTLPALATDRARTVLAWGRAQLGEPYVFGSNGPNSWDCSSFTHTAYAQIGITLPRTAAAQRDWLAHGNGYRVPASHARPGDLVFTNTYLGPNTIGHVMLVFDPTTGTSLEAGGAKVQYLKYTRYSHDHIFEIWRVGNVADHATRTSGT